jgi:hypothetical protein
MVSELKGLNLELSVQIHLQLYPMIQRQLEGFFGFSATTGGNLFTSVKLMKKYHIYLHSRELM